jgi:hypothetical protein
MATNNCINNNSLTLLSSQPVSSVTSLAFTTQFTSQYTNYVLVSTNISSAGTGDFLLGQISIDGGMSYISTLYTGNNLVTTGLMVVDIDTADATFNLNAQTYLFNIGTSSGIVSAISNTVGYSTTTLFKGATDFSVYTVPSTVVNALQLVMDDGSTFSGTFSLYGSLS